MCFNFQNSIRHNLSLHSKFVRVQNEGTGKSSWWMLNPDAKPGGKTSRRRTTSVEGANGVGGRGEIKRRGRNRKSAAANNNLRNGGLHGQTPIGPPVGGPPDGTPSPGSGLPALQHIVNNGPLGVAEGLYPESPSLHHHPNYPFPVPPGGRMSPGMQGEQQHPGAPPFGYPGQQEWPEYCSGGPMGAYFQGRFLSSSIN